jgi:hypothetical protein
MVMNGIQYPMTQYPLPATARLLSLDRQDFFFYKIHPS